jgi:hypothetical protein
MILKNQHYFKKENTNMKNMKVYNSGYLRIKKHTRVRALTLINSKSMKGCTKQHFEFVNKNDK